MRLNRRVVFVAGAGHSGSTLLGLLLGSHSSAFYAGEAAKTRFLSDPTKPLSKRACKLCGESCPVWGGFELDSSSDLYEQLSRRTGAQTIIDSTKNVGWIAARATELARTTATPVLVFLTRDGRAVVGSRLRKYPDTAPRRVIESWIDQIQRTRMLYRGWVGRRATVRYEDLAADPERVLRDLCELGGLPFEPDMLRWFARAHHPLGGNNGTQTIVARAIGAADQAPAAQLLDTRRDYYAGHPFGIRLDRRWEQELDAATLRLFDRVAGALNAEILGAPAPRLEENA